jgi:esterase/lipase superfamily enzyme
MGNRALVNALSQLQVDATTSNFKEVILAAPDIDTGVFLQLSGALRSRANRVTKIPWSMFLRKMDGQPQIDGRPRT